MITVKSTLTAKQRAAERLVGDYPVKVTAQPTIGKTVKGRPSKKGESLVRMQRSGH